MALGAVDAVIVLTPDLTSRMLDAWAGRCYMAPESRALQPTLLDIAQRETPRGPTEGRDYTVRYVPWRGRAQVLDERECDL